MTASVRSSAGTAITSSQTTHQINYPATIVAGDILFTTLTNGWDGTPSIPGWEILGLSIRSTPERMGIIVGWKVADGTETGTFTYNNTVSGWITALCVSVQDAGTPVMSSIVQGGDNSAPNSPSFSPVAGADDYLWASVAGWDRSRNVTVWPANMTTGPQLVADGGQLGSTPTSFDFLASEVATLDPDAWTIHASAPWFGITVAFPPGVAQPGNSGSHRKGPLNKPTGKPLGKGKRRGPDQPATGDGVLSPMFEWID